MEQITEEVFWAANQEAPLTRDQQIELMQTAKQRRKNNIEKWKQLEKDG